MSAPQTPVHHRSPVMSSMTSTPQTPAMMDRSNMSSAPMRLEPSAADAGFDGTRVPGHLNSLDLDDDMDTVAYVSEPPTALLCKIHNGVMVDPVIAKCGHSFCRGCLARTLQQTGKCPLDDRSLNESDLWPNLALGEQIGELLVHCRYHDASAKDQVLTCQETIKLKDRAKHQIMCPYRVIPCPHSERCEPMLQMHLEEHLAHCANIPCSFGKLGCTFRGPRSEVDAHEKTCRYEAVHEVLGDRDHRIEDLQRDLASRNAEVDLLRREVDDLSSRLQEIEGLRISDLIAKVDELSRVVRDYGDISTPGAATSAARAVDDYNHRFKCMGTYVGHTGPVWALVLHGDIIYSGSSDLAIKAWDINKQTCVRTLVGHEGIVHALIIIGRKLYSGSSDCTIRVWNLNTSELIQTVPAGDNTVCTLDARVGTNGSQSLLFSGSLKTVTVWEADTMTVVAQLKGLNHWVRALVVSEDHLYCGSYNIIMVWSLATFDCVRTITCQGGSVYSLTVDTLGQHLISGVYENRIDLWDLKTFNLKGSLNGHTAAVYALASSNTGPNRLFSGSYDNTVKVWNLETFQCVQTLIRHTSSVDAVVYGKGRIFSAAADNQIKVWG